MLQSFNSAILLTNLSVITTQSFVYVKDFEETDHECDLNVKHPTS